MDKIYKIILLNDTSCRHLGSNQVMKNILYLCKKYNFEIIKSYLKHDMDDAKFMLPKVLLKEADFILINGEGTFHHNRPYIKKLLNITRTKPTFIINSLWQQNNELVNMLNHVKLISVRETYSYAELIKIYPANKVMIAPDIFFYTDITINKIGYCDSVVKDYRNAFKERDNFFPIDTEYTIPSLQAYMSWVKTLDVCITGRFHGLCISALLNVPFLTFPSNSHKISAILHDMGCPELLITKEEEIEGKIEIAKQKIHLAHEYAISAPPKIDNVFKRIREMCDNGIS